ncbi:uncharacterized protein [Anolis sagrei]|uniref:uncharacterized protein n=1 Tax=Anolis sagrei TaxID=38937 RepID=UPI0035207725
MALELEHLNDATSETVKGHPRRMARKSDDTGLPDVKYFTFKHDYRFLQLLSLDPNFNIEEKLKKFGRTKAEDEEFLYLIRPYLRRPDRDIAQRMRLAFYPDMRKEPGWEPNIKPTRIPVSKRPTLLYRNPEVKPTKSKPAPEPEVEEERIIPPQSQWHFPPIVTKADIKELENKKLEVMCNIYTQEARMQIRREKLAAEIGIDLKKLPPVTAPGPSREQEKAVRKTQEVGGEESRKGRSKTVQWKVKQDKEITQEKTSKNQSWSRGKYHENGNGSKRKTEEVKILTQPWPTWVAAEKTLISSSANPAAVQGRLASEPPRSVENGRLSGDVRGRGSAISRCLASGGTCRSTDRETKLILKTTEAKGKQRCRNPPGKQLQVNNRPEDNWGTSGANPAGETEADAREWPILKNKQGELVVKEPHELNTWLQYCRIKEKYK